jgi:hypothetical protein
MADWKNTNYGAPATWEQLQQEERDRQFAVRFPPRWFDGFWIPTSVALTILGLVVCLGALVYIVAGGLF